ncbi:hypothetical protein [Amycolatopsis dendrobii]|uniref:Uncharacterized protein n=1 Tax=Amycolatopsis dendrobii TaxID=2760662 RepID=A0A7W3W4C5_9PSEU|nr:hypothetical protein [Amycolatopsis dendrobii]MBB1158137.1 hypothetical protein [Amycolatopsis dendrobii]
MLVGVDGGDVEELDRSTRTLRRELLAAEIDAQLPRDGHVRAGAKGGAMTVGSIVVSLAGSAVLSTALKEVMQVAKAWIARGRGRRISVTIGDRVLEISDVEPDQQQRLVDAFVTAVCQDQPK